jgi:hypothetical protein
VNDHYLQILADFFQFKFLIAEDVLSVFYLLCAICIPVAAWYFLLLVVRRYAAMMQLYKGGEYPVVFSTLLWIMHRIRFFPQSIQQRIAWGIFTPRQKFKFLTLYILMVFFAELFLRLMFEYLIAFIQMRDLLQSIAAVS